MNESDQVMTPHFSGASFLDSNRMHPLKGLSSYSITVRLGGSNDNPFHLPVVRGTLHMILSVL